MSIEKIISKIEQDAKAEADVIMDEARKGSAEIAENAAEKAEAIIARAEKRGVENRDRQVASRRSVAVIDGRNLKLNRKQELIGECFEEAMKKVSSMEDKDLLDYLTGIVKASGLKDGSIILAEKDKKYGARLLEQLREAIPGSGFELSDEVKDFSGGLILQQGNTYYNVSIEAVKDLIETGMIQEVASILFDDDQL